MFQKIGIAIVILFLILFQVSFFPYFFVQAVPDLPLIFVIFLSSRENFNVTWKRVLLVGFFMDVFSFWPIGTHLLTYSLIAFSIGALAKRFLVEHKGWGFLITLSLVVAGTIANNLFLGLWSQLLSFLDREEGQILALPFNSMAVFYRVFFNTVTFIISYSLMVKIEKIFGYHKGSRLAIK